ncbi:MAG: hypothetical protein KC469_06920, partial [Flavobacteriaceae bacterium]|nr:hypothetical protein [Flavobacteriaceae bacterium]
IISKQVPKTHIHIISEVPFSKAVTETFKIAIRENRNWTLAVDADLLLKDEAISEMIHKAEEIQGQLYIYQGMVLDYLFGDYRSGGAHLYKTSVLPYALEALSDNPYELRPESFTYKVLAKQGYVTYCDNICYGLHEYEQYSKDYYRKGFLHGKKALAPQVVALLEHWKGHIKSNEHYKIALRGLVKGLIYDQDIEVDIHFFEKLFENSNQEYNPKLENDATLVLSHSYVIDEINRHQQEYQDRTPNSFTPFMRNKMGKLVLHNRYTLGIKSWVARAVYFLGAKLIDLSKRL